MIKGLLLFSAMAVVQVNAQVQSWIRINQLGYTPGGIKVAVWCSKEEKELVNWELVNSGTKNIVAKGKAGKAFGKYGPFTQTYRINFSSFKKPGRYYLQAGGARSPEFEIGDEVYQGAADFCLRYMRQQRSGFNPYLKDSCHTHDGYVLYGERAGIKDSTFIDVSGGWHDASDYLQYSSTSANATYHLLAAYRDFPQVFTDTKQANGLDGKNGLVDVLDEARWGLDWLLKMHPRPDWMFNQIGDDRDHISMRIPKEDTQYGKGFQRPVYFVSGEPQQRGKFMNATTGTSSTAGKFASAFALGAKVFSPLDTTYSDSLIEKAQSALGYAYKKRGVTQTASVRSPYIYAEENWVDDMELAMITVDNYTDELKGYRVSMRGPLIAMRFAAQEPVTPWMENDTANHYQWYPFINIGHYELQKSMLMQLKEELLMQDYKKGIQFVWERAKQNAFYRGVPFIWCSNNLTTSFAIQCYWYKQLTGDKTFDELEQANLDWLFGCNPWGTSMIYGLPAWGDTPIDPHSAFTHLKNYPIDGGLVDGPVYTNIYKGLIGIKLYKEDEYAAFQSDLAVYHDDYGDYSTNEPTMDGTASLIYLLASKESESSLLQRNTDRRYSFNHGAITRGDSATKNIALVFTGHEFAEGGDFILKTLQQEKVNASFFFTGDFYKRELIKKVMDGNETIVDRLKKAGNYLGPHSDKHLLYCDWKQRNKLLVTKDSFITDMRHNIYSMRSNDFGHNPNSYFLPPYEWHNDSIATWTKEIGIQLINYTPGTFSHADYTTEADKNFRSSEAIYQSIINYEQQKPNGLNGFILLLHVGAGPERKDKFYHYLPQLIKYLKTKGYQLKRIDEMLND